MKNLFFVAAFSLLVIFSTHAQTMKTLRWKKVVTVENKTSGRFEFDYEGTTYVLWQIKPGKYTPAKFTQFIRQNKLVMVDENEAPYINEILLKDYISIIASEEQTDIRTLTTVFSEDNKATTLIPTFNFKGIELFKVTMEHYHGTSLPAGIYLTKSAQSPKFNGDLTVLPFKNYLEIYKGN